MFSAKIGERVVLNMKGINHVRDSFGNLSGIADPWMVTGRTHSALVPTYTLLNKRGTVFEGVKEDFISPVPIIDYLQDSEESSDSE